jgi:hypothetical protein
MRALDRRQFLAFTGAALASVLIGCQNDDDAAAPLEGSVTVFKLSSRGRRTSRAAKSHNANHLFTTAAAAEGHRAHPGDTSRVVSVTISAAEFDRLFTPGQNSVDLRQV